MATRNLPCGVFDCHAHSAISSDCDAPMAEMAAAAKARGLAGITFTEHVDFGFPNPNVKHADADAYRAMHRQVCAEFSDFPVLRGVELGFEYGYEVQCQSFIQALCPDQIICSVHSLDGMTLYCAQRYPKGQQHGVYARYLEKVYDSIRLCRDFDVLGHIGFVAKRAEYPDPALHYAPFQDQIDAILRALIESGRALEANTSGFRTCGDTLPEQSILRRYRQLGGELLTIGSDAHAPQAVGFHFEDALARIRACGFSYLTHYEKRKAVMTPL